MKKDGIIFQVALLLKVTKTNLVVTKLAAGGHKHDSKVLLRYPGSTQQSFKRGGSSQRHYPFPLNTIFGIKGTPFVTNGTPFVTYLVFLTAVNVLYLVETFRRVRQLVRDLT